MHNVSSEYPQYKQLFKSYLMLRNVDVGVIVIELRYFSDDASTERLKELLLLLNKYLKRKVPSDLMSDLREKKIFPVKNLAGDIDRRSYDEYNWYFADRQSLWDSFNGKLPLLDLDVKTVRALRPLIEALAMIRWQLSEADETKLEKVGDPIRDDEKTQDLKQRAVHFLQ